MKSKDVKVTADDWGMSPGVNAGILDLARHGIVQRVSILANGGFVTSHLEDLKKIRGLELGIHFNVTFGSPSLAEKESAFRVLTVKNGTSFRSLFGLSLLWLTGSNRQKLLTEIRWSLRGQLHILNRLGVSPTYFDSHHHIHLLPGLLRGLADDLKQNDIETIRLPLDPQLMFTKRLMLFFLSLSCQKEIDSLGFKVSRCHYPSISQLSDREYIRRTLAKTTFSEILVHPARYLDFDILNIDDGYQSGRLKECEILSSWPRDRSLTSVM